MSGLVLPQIFIKLPSGRSIYCPEGGDFGKTGILPVQRLQKITKYYNKLQFFTKYKVVKA